MNWMARAALAAVLLSSGATHAQEVDFGGKTVRLYQNFAAGGSTDLFARTLAPFVEKYLPGNPTVVVEPRPGAAGIAAATYMHNSSDPNGLEICLCNSLPTRWVTLQDFKFDVRDYGIAGSQPVNTVILIRNDMNVEKPADLASTPRPLLFAGTSPADLNGNRFTVFADIFGADVRIIGGYKTTGNYLQATQQGETNVTSVNGDYFAVQKDTITESGALKVLGQVGVPGEGGFVRDSAIDAPTFSELIDEGKPEAVGTPEHRLFQAFNQAAGIQFLYVLAPGTPQPIVDAWESALKQAVADPEYAAAVEGMQAAVRPFLDQAGTKAALEELWSGFKEPEMVELLQEMAPAYFK